MARLQIVGFETGDLSEVSASAGTVAASTVQKRTGAYSLRINPAAAASYVRIRGLAATGVGADLGLTTCYYSFYIYFVTIPASAHQIAVVNPSQCFLYLNSSSAGELSVFGNPEVATGFFPTTGVWYHIEVKSVTSGASTLRIDGGADINFTGRAGTQTNIELGDSGDASSTYDTYYDDIVIDSAAYPGVGQVNILKPNGTGNYTAWTDGAGTAPTNVAEAPHDSDTSYITSQTNAAAETEALDSAATGGVGGTIAATKTCAIVRDVTGVSSIQVRTRSATTDQDTTAVDPGATYVLLAKLNVTDPATSAAWTSGGLDAMEAGVVCASATTALRCTALYVMVECAGSVTTTKTLSVTSTGVATMVRSVGKPFAATSTGTATMVRGINKALAVTSTGTATLLKSVGKILSVISTATATMTRSHAFGVVMSVTSTVAATMVRSVGKILSVTSTGTATLTKSAAFGMILNVTSTGLATLSMAVSRFTAAISIPNWGTRFAKPNWVAPKWNAARWQPPKWRRPW